MDQQLLEVGELVRVLATTQTTMRQDDSPLSPGLGRDAGFNKFFFEAMRFVILSPDIVMN